MSKFLVVSFLTCTIALTAQPIHGATTISPAFFSLPRSAFPAPSSVVRSDVEPNQWIHRDNILHFGTSFAKEGRLTGYFMEAIEGERASPRSDTSYLVSIFATDQQASSAFGEQRYYWDALATHGGAAAVSLHNRAYGDAGDAGLYAVSLPTGASLAELLFRRGPLFIEVFQEVDAARPSHAEVRAFFAIGTRLDIIARGALAS